MATQQDQFAQMKKTVEARNYQQQRQLPPSSGAHPLPPSSARSQQPPPAAPAEQPTVDIPSIIPDSKTGLTYLRGKLLGKGGFARCFEVTETKTKSVFACKIVNKGLLLKQHQKEKMVQEIKIHRDLRHKYIVNFLSHFEDDANVFITLELCTKKSLMELQKRRRCITEPESKYFLRQIVQAVEYLHDEKHIIHRDLKLGNIFISEDICLKIGDFGLATTILFDGERKKTLCGTPNYIAPEILGKKGHSYQVDIWSIGCILYTLLMGRPPFETSTLRDTYRRIKRGEYTIPRDVHISTNAKNLLIKLLQVNPMIRPTAGEILRSEFMMQGFIPSTLPASVLVMAPRFDRPPNFGQSIIRTTAAPVAPPTVVIAPGNPLFKKPLGLANQPATGSSDGTASGGFIPPTAASVRSLAPSTAPHQQEPPALYCDMDTKDLMQNMISLRDQIRKIVSGKLPRTKDDDNAEDPSLCPLLWICKWVDYTDKYGFGYHLSDDTVGVSYNDQTKMILLPDAKSVHYIDKEGNESYHTMKHFPDELLKKIKLLKFFEQYMHDNLIKATDGRIPPPPSDCIARVPNMWTWFRSSRSVVMVLSSGTMQINNFRDHTKLILCPLLGAVTTLGSNKGMRTYSLSRMLEGGLSAELVERLAYALDKIEVIIGHSKENVSANVVESPAKKV